METKTQTKYVGGYGKPIETTETQEITTTFEPKTKMQTQSQNRTYGRNLVGNSNISGKKVISKKTDEKNIYSRREKNKRNNYYKNIFRWY